MGTVKELGRIVITAGASKVLDAFDTAKALGRHSIGDWGNLPEVDIESNNIALINGERLLSAYKSKTGIDFWVVTEWDRSVTTILLPSDY